MLITESVLSATLIRGVAINWTWPYGLKQLWLWHSILFNMQVQNICFTTEIDKYENWRKSNKLVKCVLEMWIDAVIPTHILDFSCALWRAAALCVHCTKAVGKGQPIHSPPRMTHTKTRQRITSKLSTTLRYAEVIPVCAFNISASTRAMQLFSFSL